MHLYSNQQHVGLYISHSKFKAGLNEVKNLEKCKIAADHIAMEIILIFLECCSKQFDDGLNRLLFKIHIPLSSNKR
jgi:hypothetical protein